MAELTRAQRELAQFLNYVISRNSVIELRLFHDNKTFAGYFDSFQDAYKALTPVPRRKPGIPFGDYPRDGEASGIYWTLNGVHKNFLGKSNNRIKYAGKGDTTSDADIIVIRHLLIDCDPIRNPTTISSTREEKHAAAGVARRIRRWLKKQGVVCFPGDSGNGIHLLVPVKFEGKDQIELAHKNTCILLAYLKKTFSTPAVSVDSTVSNPARINKLYGTMVRKGDSIADRPHRRSAIHLKKWMLETPDQDIFTLTGSTVDYSVTPVSETTRTATTTTTSSSGLTLEVGEENSGKKHDEHVELIRSILTGESLEYREKAKGTGRIVFEFKTCPVHTDYDDHTFECAIMVESNGAFSAKCQHDDTKKWSDFKEAINYTKYRANKSEKSEKTVKSDAIITAEDRGAILSVPRVVPIGFYKSNLLFFCMDSKQFLEYPAADIHVQMMCSDWEYWLAYCPEAFYYDEKKEEHFLRKEGIQKIKEQLIYDVKKTGKRMDNITIRETGMYYDRKRIIFNAGSKLFVDGVEQEYQSVDSDYLYQSSNNVITSIWESTTDEYYEVCKLLSETTLDTDVDAWLLPGVIMSGYMSGMSPWRSHAWINGPKGSGKSDFVDLILDPLIAPIGGIRKDSDLTEAGIRQSIQKRCTVFLHDEAESNIHIDKELALIRTCSHGGLISKGTVSGKALEFTAKSTFILCSISDSVVAEADKERFIFFGLKHRNDTAEQWASLKDRIRTMITPELAAKFCRRMMNRAKDYLTLFHDVRSALIEFWKRDKRGTNQSVSRYADLYAGPIAAHFIMTRDTVDELDIENDYFRLFRWLDTAGKLHGVFLSTADNFGNMSVALYNLFLDSLVKIEDSSTGRTATRRIRDVMDDDLDALKTSLNIYGIYYLPNTGHIKLKSSSRFLLDLFNGLGYRNFGKILAGVPDAIYPGPDRRVGKEHFRGIELPYPLLMDGEVRASSIISMALDQPVEKEVGTINDDLMSVLGL